METTILVIFAIIGALMAFWAAMKPIMDDSKIRNKVLNFDEGMRHYYFLLETGENETEAALAEPLEQAAVEYSFRPEDGVITFRRENVEADYRLRFFTAEGKTYLCVGRVAEEREKGNIPYLVNAFFIINLHAKPVDFRKIQALLGEELAD